MDEPLDLAATPVEVCMLVMHYLRAHGFGRTAAAFKREASASLPVDFRRFPRNMRTLESLLSEYLVLRHREDARATAARQSRLAADIEALLASNAGVDPPGTLPGRSRRHVGGHRPGAWAGEAVGAGGSDGSGGAVADGPLGLDASSDGGGVASGRISRGTSPGAPESPLSSLPLPPPPAELPSLGGDPEPPSSPPSSGGIAVSGSERLIPASGVTDARLIPASGITDARSIPESIPVLTPRALHEAFGDSLTMMAADAAEVLRRQTTEEGVAAAARSQARDDAGRRAWDPRPVEQGEGVPQRGEGGGQGEVQLSSPSALYASLPTPVSFRSADSPLPRFFSPLPTPHAASRLSASARAAAAATGDPTAPSSSFSSPAHAAGMSSRHGRKASLPRKRRHSDLLPAPSPLSVEGARAANAANGTPGVAGGATTATVAAAATHPPFSMVPWPSGRADGGAATAASLAASSATPPVAFAQRHARGAVAAPAASDRPFAAVAPGSSTPPIGNLPSATALGAAPLPRSATPHSAAASLAPPSGSSLPLFDGATPPSGAFDPRHARLSGEGAFLSPPPFGLSPSTDPSLGLGPGPGPGLLWPLSPAGLATPEFVDGEKAPWSFHELLARSVDERSLAGMLDDEETALRFGAVVARAINACIGAESDPEARDEQAKGGEARVGDEGNGEERNEREREREMEEGTETASGALRKNDVDKTPDPATQSKQQQQQQQQQQRHHQQPQRSQSQPSVSGATGALERSTGAAARSGAGPVSLRETTVREAALDSSRGAAALPPDGPDALSSLGAAVRSAIQEGAAHLQPGTASASPPPDALARDPRNPTDAFPPRSASRAAARSASPTPPPPPIALDATSLLVSAAWADAGFTQLLGELAGATHADGATTGLRGGDREERGAKEMQADGEEENDRPSGNSGIWLSSEPSSAPTATATAPVGASGAESAVRAGLGVEADLRTSTEGVSEARGDVERVGCTEVEKGAREEETEKGTGSAETRGAEDAGVDTVARGGFSRENGATNGVERERGLPRPGVGKRPTSRPPSNRDVNGRSSALDHSQRHEHVDEESRADHAGERVDRRLDGSRRDLLSHAPPTSSPSPFPLGNEPRAPAVGAAAGAPGASDHLISPSRRVGEVAPRAFETSAGLRGGPSGPPLESSQASVRSGSKGSRSSVAAESSLSLAGHIRAAIAERRDDGASRGTRGSSGSGSSAARRTPDAEAGSRDATSTAARAETTAATASRLGAEQAVLESDDAVARSGAARGDAATDGSAARIDEDAAQLGNVAHSDDATARPNNATRPDTTAHPDGIWSTVGFASSRSPFAHLFAPWERSQGPRISGDAAIGSSQRETAAERPESDVEGMRRNLERQAGDAETPHAPARLAAGTPAGDAETPHAPARLAAGAAAAPDAVAPPTVASDRPASSMQTPPPAIAAPSRASGGRPQTTMTALARRHRFAAEGGESNAAIALDVSRSLAQPGRAAEDLEKILDDVLGD